MPRKWTGLNLASISLFFVTLSACLLQVVFTSNMFGVTVKNSGMTGTGTTAGPTKRTHSPMVTGTSVLGVKYNGGVMLAADTLASYGSLARFKDVTRLNAVGDYTILGAGGEFSDFQAIQEILEKMDQEDKNADDGFSHSPAELFNYLRAIFYSKRNKFNPLWNEVLVGGFKDGKAFLGHLDMIGTAFSDEVMATGFGSYLALPIMRKRWHANMTEGEARALLEDCMRVLFYRWGPREGGREGGRKGE
ncbi:20S proteasome subunit beta 7, partial [Nannochloropsis gaditana CCMP526]|uniref:20S proteasome subunit beta 7 n=1 Tax=Nannochloropsis gaditana (strain CCMP526) TaxID=1093141 RepID=UPI00029F6701